MPTCSDIKCIFIVQKCKVVGIERKLKKCIKCEQFTVIFSHGRCKDCANKDAMKLKSKIITENVKRDVAFYKTIWNSRRHMCEICELPIGEPHTFNFHHILEKSKYPTLRYTEDNIAIVCWNCHTNIHNRFGDFSSFDERIERLKQQISN